MNHFNSLFLNQNESKQELATYSSIMANYIEIYIYNYKIQL